MRPLTLLFMVIFFCGLVYKPGKSGTQITRIESFVMPGVLHTGDIVLRNGKGFISEMFRKTSRHDRKYSHAGIIRVTPSGILVMHIIGENGSEKNNLKIQTLEDFCSSTSNFGYAVYRYPFLKGLDSEVAVYLKQLSKDKLTFDDHFDLDSDNEQYCSELIYKMCLTIGKTELATSAIDGLKFVGLDDLYFNNTAILVSQQSYLQ